MFKKYSIRENGLKSQLLFSLLLGNLGLSLSWKYSVICDHKIDLPHWYGLLDLFCFAPPPPVFFMPPPQLQFICCYIARYSVQK